MDIHRQLEEILIEMNGELPPQDRVTAQEIADAGQELNTMLKAATQETAGRFQAAVAIAVIAVLVKSMSLLVGWVLSASCV